MTSSRWSRLAASACLLILLASCSPSPEADLLSPWNYSDLRALDPAEAASPACDLIAVYLRQDEESVQIRLDLLETDRFDEFDLYLALDSRPGGTQTLPLEAQSQIEWDTLIRIPAHGSISVQSERGDAVAGAAVLVVRDPGTQALLVRLERDALGAGLGGLRASRPLKIQVFLAAPGTRAVVDQSEPAALAGQPPEPAQVLFAFWDAFPAYTPGTALRRWDGAHTGPNGGRHGLYNLLRTAQASQIPLFLLDLNEPAALSALDYAGGVDWVEALSQAGLVTLPVSLPDPRYAPFPLDPAASNRLGAWQAQVAEDYGFSSRGFFYLPPGAPISAVKDGLVFVRRPPNETGDLDSGPVEAGESPLLEVERWGGKLVFPLGDEVYRSASGVGAPPVQAGCDGLALEWKKRLVSAALQAGASSEAPSGGETGPVGYVNLGGDLPGSAWGDPQAARASFQWLKKHPWVRVLGAQDLLGMRPAGGEASPPLQSQQTQSIALQPEEDLAAALQSAPDNALGAAAWQAFQALYDPFYPAPGDLPALRANYTGQVWSLLEAARWAAAPAAQASCSEDPDRDGQPECLLSTEEVYAQFEIDDGSLTWLFARRQETGPAQGQAEEPHELVGPSSQLISGLSDPATWNLQSGLRADPSVIPGAFSGPGEGFQAEIIPGGVYFSRADGEGSKIFSLSQQGVTVEVQLPRAGVYPEMQIPLSLDPWRRFSPGWAGQYHASQTPGTFAWGFAEGPTLQVSATSALQAADFKASQGLFAAPEDPNQDFPGGHFLPFPLALVRVQGQAQFEVRIDLR